MLTHLGPEGLVRLPVPQPHLGIDLGAVEDPVGLLGQAQEGEGQGATLAGAIRVEALPSKVKDLQVARGADNFWLWGSYRTLGRGRHSLYHSDSVQEHPLSICQLKICVSKLQQRRPGRLGYRSSQDQRTVSDRRQQNLL